MSGHLDVSFGERLYIGNTLACVTVGEFDATPGP